MAKRPGQSSEAWAAYMRAWHAANPEKVAAYNARRRARYVERQRANRLANYRDNIERERAYQAAYRESHRDERRKAFEAWRLANPEQDRTRCARRRARKAGAAGSHTTQEWLALCAAFDNRCAYCRKEEKLERDHVVPLTRGGSDDISNILPACKPCNAGKHNRLPSEWLGYALAGTQAPV